ncbi:MAG: transcriptional regulator [Desulfuromonadales bacterium]
MREKKPPVPSSRQTTIRRQIQDVLEQETLSARDISAAVGIPEKDVYGHLEHLQRSLQRENRRLDVTPAQCRKCGFVFTKRNRLSRPGKCPICRGESIEEPLFEVV